MVDAVSAAALVAVNCSFVAICLLADVVPSVGESSAVATSTGVVVAAFYLQLDWQQRGSSTADAGIFRRVDIGYA